MNERSIWSTRCQGGGSRGGSIPVAGEGAGRCGGHSWDLGRICGGGRVRLAGVHLKTSSIVVKAVVGRSVRLIAGPGGPTGRTPHGVHTRPSWRKLCSNLSRIWIHADEKMDVNPFASARWSMIST